MIRSSFQILLIILFGSVAFLFAIKYSSYKTKYMMIKDDGKQEVLNSVYVLEKNNTLNELLQEDRENAENKLHSIEHNASNDHFIDVLQQWDKKLIFVSDNDKHTPGRE